MRRPSFAREATPTWMSASKESEACRGGMRELIWGYETGRGPRKVISMRVREGDEGAVGRELGRREGAVEVGRWVRTRWWRADAV